MKLIGLTGGMGSGKSTVAKGLADRGAAVVDADAIVRELQQPGRPVYLAMVEQWGQRIVNPSGTLDRAEVAKLVFGNSAELQILNQIVHPSVRREMQARIDQADDVVILDSPLLIESIKDDSNAERSGVVSEPTGSTPTPAHIIVVDCPNSLAIDRLVRYRGFSPADAAARLATQLDRSERLTYADFVIDNSSNLLALEAEIERCWRWIELLPHGLRRAIIQSSDSTSIDHSEDPTK